MFEKYAGFWKRFAAHLIDQLILGFARTIILIPFWIYLAASIFYEYQTEYQKEFVAIGIDSFGDIPFFTIIKFIIVVSLFSMLIDWLYYALMESSKKQATLGKVLMSLKVVDMNGERISFGRASGRYFGKILSGLIFMIGYIMAAFTEKKQALHDILSNCLVVNTLYVGDEFFTQSQNRGDTNETATFQ